MLWSLVFVNQYIKRILKPLQYFKCCFLAFGVHHIQLLCTHILPDLLKFIFGSSKYATSFTVYSFSEYVHYRQ